ncbi:uncharacterized protein CC84DRAFT_1183918 [Paraphaeosphaeria sporulosa]|uniref:Basic proline-rich protein n=1 Tax=Paraphaeosphaeria sporulosa TaxID=1460663 RepID=A0A177CQ43_9PLEO|nr:uncharacterized protein CC84DRAFT_1183918 [Paraphaeosphaeria sporulosa]OAG09645.1 hypothetical protein CC84DRAFT_1183918 [Paraphaeosphaeria sporulosa]
MTANNLTAPPSPPARAAAAVDDDLVPSLHALTTATPTTQDKAARSLDTTASAVSLKEAVALTRDPPTAQSTADRPEQPPPSPEAETPVATLPAMGKAMGSPPSERRPSTPRAQTEPAPSFDMLPTHTPRARNRSPYSRSHLRSSSGSSLVFAPPMMRAHSLPTVMNPTGHLALSPSPVPARPSSPLRSPKRTRSPRSQPTLYEDSYAHSGAPSVCDISEDAELELTPNMGTAQPSPISSLYSSTSSLSRRRRPASPLHQVAFGGAPMAPPVRTPTSGSPSPLLSAAKFNEPFPGMSSHYPISLSSSSVPPSISSLETIPDTPDEEEEAIEADRIAKLKAAADREEERNSGRRSSLDVPGGSGRAFGFGKRDSRKRWSVCGAERRGDLDLETIWED